MVGDEQADWLIVGEAPDENEDIQGEPFVGQAGKLLDNMLRAIGLAVEFDAAPLLHCTMQDLTDRSQLQSELSDAQGVLRGVSGLVPAFRRGQMAVLARP